ncbi:hypothetical protein ACTVZO_19220 [Streptomyces sp. IBSNAI002]|uniref:hypothetical protein n=1 Tax=Streptomyces sp. IBSNAI002 TaxID=3457500 RepID=UPI003FD5CAEA
MRRVAVRSVVLAGLLAFGGAVPAGAAPVGAGPVGSGPEADVAYHGRVSLARGQLRIWLVPQNEGPSALPNTTVRVRLSADLADRQELSEGCARVGPREVVCETGPLPLRGRGRHIGLLLELRERAPEVVVRVDTWWNGGATDRNHANNEHVVLALDTGDAYAF